MLRLLHLVLALQAHQATIVGTVRDAETGEPLRAAIVTLNDLDRTALTDSSGAYSLRDVPAGPQHLSVGLLGYAHRTMHALVPAAGELVINVMLQPDPIPIRSIAVRPVVELRGADANGNGPLPDRTASNAAVRNHPLLAEPDAFQAMGGGEVVVMPESPSGVHIRGGASDQTAYVIDGIPVLSPYHAAGLFSAWNPDALSRVSLTSTMPSPALPSALSGVVQGTTRAPGSQLGAQGSFTTTQTRVTIDGPLGVGDAGYLLSLRSSYPDFIAPRGEPSYLLGESGDMLAKLEASGSHDVVRVIAYDSDNEIETARSAIAATGIQPRNAFRWHSRSVGTGWTHRTAHATVEVQAWSAVSDAHAIWATDSIPTTYLGAASRDQGLLMVWTRRESRASTSSGIRAWRSRTSYDIAADSGSTGQLALHIQTPVALVFFDHWRRLDDDLEVTAVASLAEAEREVRPALQAQLRWQPVTTLAVTGSVARLHQFTQSLRNTESLTGNIFPVDLYVGAGRAGVPIARSDQVILAADLRPWAGARVAAQLYRRTSRGLLMVAPRAATPFAITDIETGTASAYGAAADLTLSGSRYGVIGSYGWQHTRFSYPGGRFTPAFAAVHSIELGLIVFPSATSSVRIGAVAELGRRASPAVGGFEWESCNLLDRGCEFAGSPLHPPATIGSSQLPAYVRADLGVRKHWHIDIGHRDAMLAVFGTATNLFNRKNLLDFAYDPATGNSTAIEMRPRSPLVVGIDWRF